MLVGGWPLSERFLRLWGDHPDAHERAHAAFLPGHGRVPGHRPRLVVLLKVVAEHSKGGVWLATLVRG